MFFLLLIFFLANPIHAYAETKVEIKLIGNYFDSENNLEVDVSAGLSDIDFKIRPRIEPYQTLFTYSDGAIFSLGSFWTDLPSIPKNLTLHTPIPFNTANIWFEILDTKAGKTYETPKKQVFGRKFIESYILDLNKNLFRW